MMNYSISISFLLFAALHFHEVCGAPRDPTNSNKVFNYQGSLPIRDDRVEEVIKNQANDTGVTTNLPFDQGEAEAACWKMINEQSGM